MRKICVLGAMVACLSLAVWVEAAISNARADQTSDPRSDQNDARSLRPAKGDERNTPLFRNSASAGNNPLDGALPVIFDSERIRLHIVRDSLEVRGTYYLLCVRPTNQDLALFYPFPSDSMLGGSRMVSLEVRPNAGEFAPARWDLIPGGRGVRWWMPPCAADTLIVESVYRQKLLGDYARYIVTTTRSWERPLRRARFEIHLPDSVTPTEFSFPFEKRTGHGAIWYAFEAEDFFPDRDIVVKWGRQR